MKLNLYPRNSWMIAAFFAAVIMISAVIVLSHDGRVPAHPMDQSFVSSADLRIGQQNGAWYFNYPHLQWSGGITASLIVGLYKLIIPASSDHLNHHIKIFAMLLFFITGYLLASRYIKTRPGLALFIAIMATSGFQFIEPTSELIAAAYLFAFLYGISRRWNVFISAFFLVCFALCKAEFTLPAGLIMFYWAWVTPSRGLKALIVGGFVFWLAVFIAPGIYLYGRENFLGAEGHAFAAFGPHYSALMAKYKLIDYPANNAWPQWVKIMSEEFPKAKSFSDLVIRYPQKYLLFVLLSAWTGIGILILTFKGLLGVLALRWARYKEKIMPNHFEPMILIGLIASIIPATLIAFLHSRYLGKSLILYSLISVVFWEYCRERSDKPAYAWQARIILALLILTLVLQALGLKFMIQNAHFL